MQDNILLLSNGTAKIGDFGTATGIQSGRLTYGAGTSRYLAPETIGAFYTSKVDIYRYVYEFVNQAVNNLAVLVWLFLKLSCT